MNFSTQIHDYNPGIDPYPDGLFWTVPVDDNAVKVQLGAGKASMEAEDIAVGDYGKIPNGLFHITPPVDATVSFDIQWSRPVTSSSEVNDPTNQVAAELFLNEVAIQWSSRNANGFKFVSDPAGQTSVFAQLGSMRNGVFY